MKHESGIFNGFISVMDIMPTFMEIAGIKHPGEKYRGRNVNPIKGVSVNTLLNGESSMVHDENHVIGWELFAKRAIRQGKWKAIVMPEPYGPNDWQLYNLDEDIYEANDLSQSNPKKMQEMIGLWEEYAKENSVIIPSEVDRY